MPYLKTANWTEIWPMLHIPAENNEFLLPPFKVTVLEPLYLINNSPPEFAAALNPITLTIGETYEYHLEPTIDYENNTVYVESWKLNANEEYSWIQLKNSSNIAEV